MYYSPLLWATHDGGAHWRRISLGGDIRAMTASTGTVYAMVSRHAGYELFSSPAGKNAWARVGTMTGSSLAVFGKAAWFGTSTYLWATADGVHWPPPAAADPERRPHLACGQVLNHRIPNGPVQE